MTLQSRPCTGGGRSHRWRRTAPTLATCADCGKAKTVRELAPKSRTPINARSAKRASLDQERAAWKAKIIRRRDRCELPELIRVAYWSATVRTVYADDSKTLTDVIGRCGHRSVDMHEIESRGRTGGVIAPSQGLTEDDIMMLCRSCHRWVTENPRLATIIGATASYTHTPTEQDNQP